MAALKLYSKDLYIVYEQLNNQELWKKADLTEQLIINCFM